MVAGHVVLDISCLDRLYLTGYVAKLQTPGRVVYFPRDHHGKPIASPAPALLCPTGPERKIVRRAIAATGTTGAIGHPHDHPPPGNMSYDHPMRRPASDYAAAAVFLVLFAIGGLVTTLLSPHESAALRLWASTNVASLQHHPVPALVLSAFLPSGPPFAWLALIALTMFGANRAVGTARLALICAAGHLIGTGVSEGIVAYRVDYGSLPPAWSHIPDVGPSYVVVSAIVVAVMFGTWLTRVTALAVFAVLVFVSHIFAGLTSLHVAAVGHLTAIVTAAALGLVLAVRQRGVRAGADGMTPAPDGCQIKMNVGVVFGSWLSQRLSQQAGVAGGVAGHVAPEP